MENVKILSEETTQGNILRNTPHSICVSTKIIKIIDFYYYYNILKI